MLSLFSVGTPKVLMVILPCCSAAGDINAQLEGLSTLKDVFAQAISWREQARPYVNKRLKGAVNPKEDSLQLSALQVFTVHIFTMSRSMSNQPTQCFILQLGIFMSVDNHKSQARGILC